MLLTSGVSGPRGNVKRDCVDAPFRGARRGRLRMSQREKTAAKGYRAAERRGRRGACRVGVGAGGVKRAVIRECLELSFLTPGSQLSPVFLCLPPPRAQPSLVHSGPLPQHAAPVAGSTAQHGSRRYALKRNVPPFSPSANAELHSMLPLRTP